MRLVKCLYLLFNLQYRKIVRHTLKISQQMLQDF